MAELRKRVAEKLNLSDEDTRKRYRTGTGTLIFSDRVHWAKDRLKNAGLLHQPQRGQAEITQQGRKILERHDVINNAALRRISHEGQPPAGDAPDEIASAAAGKTPEERIADAHGELEKVLKDDILQHVRSASPAFFENVVIKLLEAMGYGVGRVTGGVGDGGVDGVVDQDRLGIDRVYVQAKRYGADNKITPDLIRQFAGSLDTHNALKGIFVTTSSFTEKALQQIERQSKPIVLVDGDRLAALMLEYNVGFREVQSLSIKRIDEDFFEDE